MAAILRRSGRIGGQASKEQLATREGLLHGWDILGRTCLCED